MTDYDINRLIRGEIGLRSPMKQPSPRVQRELRNKAIEKSMNNRWWKVTYTCGSVRFQPAPFKHELSSLCSEWLTYLVSSRTGPINHLECSIFAIEKLPATVWTKLRQQLGGRRMLTVDEYGRMQKTGDWREKG